MGALIGSLNGGSTWFPIGAGPTVVPGPGPLLLAANDCLGPGGSFYSDNSGSLTVTITTTRVQVAIDIKPGSFPNSINLGSNGTTPVAILGSATLDVDNIDADTLTLGTAGVKTVGKTDRLLCSVADVSGDFTSGLEGAPDGFLDLVCHFVTVNIVPEAGDAVAKVMGDFIGGGGLEGTDSVNIVP
jgi:hypothetical protein